MFSMGWCVCVNTHKFSVAFFIILECLLYCDFFTNLIIFILGKAVADPAGRLGWGGGSKQGRKNSSASAISLDL